MAAALPSSARARYTAIMREGAWVVVGQGGAIVAALLGLAQLTRFLDPDEYGRVALALTVGNLFNLVGFGILASGAARFLSASRDSGEQGALFAGLLRLIFQRARVLGGLGIAVAAIAAVTISADAGLFALVALLFSFAFSTAGAFEVMLNAERARSAVAFHKMLQQVLNYGIAFVLLATVEASSRMVLLGFTIGTAVTAASEYGVLTRGLSRTGSGSFRQETRDAWMQRIREYIQPAQRWAIPQWLQLASDRWILAALQGTGQAGLYAVVYQLGFTPLGLFSTLMSQTIDPVVFARAGDAATEERLRHADRLRHRAALLFGLGTLGVVLGAFLLHRPLFAILVDPAYQQGSGWLPWMACAAGLFGLAQIQALKWMTRLRPQRLEVSRIVSAVAGVGFVAVGAYFGGATGVVIAQVLNAALLFIWTLSLR
jgi:O-antigen/teichoic acid export membrane protein